MTKRDWVDCPICGESDMRRETDPQGNSLIFCVNHGCQSNNATGENAAPEKPEIVQHWYLVCWQSSNGKFGSTEIWFDRPWRKGDMAHAIRSIEASNRTACGIALTSVTPIG